MEEHIEITYRKPRKHVVTFDKAMKSMLQIQEMMKMMDDMTKRLDEISNDVFTPDRCHACGVKGCQGGCYYD